MHVSLDGGSTWVNDNGALPNAAGLLTGVADANQPTPSILVVSPLSAFQVLRSRRISSFIGATTPTRSIPSGPLCLFLRPTPARRLPHTSIAGSSSSSRRSRGREISCSSARLPRTHMSVRSIRHQLPTGISWTSRTRSTGTCTASFSPPTSRRAFKTDIIRRLPAPSGC